jgi:hypothetical protein
LFQVVHLQDGHQWNIWSLLRYRIVRAGKQLHSFERTYAFIVRVWRSAAKWS